MSARLLLAGFTLLSAFMFPWWVGMCGAFLLALRWRAWEVVIVGALYDVLWLPSTFLYGLPLGTCVAILFVWCLEPLRRQLLLDA